MVAIGCIAAAAHIDPSYSTGDASVHPHLIHSSFVPSEPNCLNGIWICPVDFTVHRSAQHVDGQTDKPRYVVCSNRPL